MLIQSDVIYAASVFREAADVYLLQPEVVDALAFIELDLPTVLRDSYLFRFVASCPSHTTRVRAASAA